MVLRREGRKEDSADTNDCETLSNGVDADTDIEVNVKLAHSDKTNEQDKYEIA
jgi:hypothetical protein